MRQSRFHSALEAISNTVTGYLVAVLANLLILPWFGLHPSVSDSFLIGAAFTVVSLARSYALRRLFESFRNV